MPKIRLSAFKDLRGYVDQFGTITSFLDPAKDSVFENSLAGVALALRANLAFLTLHHIHYEDNQHRANIVTFIMPTLPVGNSENDKKDPEKTQAISREIGKKIAIRIFNPLLWPFIALRFTKIIAFGVIDLVVSALNLIPLLNTPIPGTGWLVDKLVGIADWILAKVGLPRQEKYIPQANMSLGSFAGWFCKAVITVGLLIPDFLAFTLAKTSDVLEEKIRGKEAITYMEMSQEVAHKQTRINQKATTITNTITNNSMMNKTLGSKNKATNSNTITSSSPIELSQIPTTSSTTQGNIDHQEKDIRMTVRR